MKYSVHTWPFPTWPLLKIGQIIKDSPRQSTDVLLRWYELNVVIQFPTDLEYVPTDWLPMVTQEH